MNIGPIVLGSLDLLSSLPLLLQIPWSYIKSFLCRFINVSRKLGQRNALHLICGYLNMCDHGNKTLHQEHAIFWPAEPLYVSVCRAFVFDNIILEN